MAHITAGTKNITLPFTVWNAGITGVSGGVNKGDTLTITGRDFGIAPSIDEVFYDGCDGTGTRTVNDANLGVWDEVFNSNTPDLVATYESGGRDGGNCLRGISYDPVAEDSLHVSQKLSFTNSRKFYLSFWLRWMPDTFFPTNLVAGRNTFDGIASTMKMSWPQYTDENVGGGSTNDIVFPGQPRISGLRGNDVPAFTGNVGYNLDEQWDGNHRQEWTKFTLYIEVDADRTAPAPWYYKNMYPASLGQKVFSAHDNFAILENSEPTVDPVFNTAYLFSWFRGGSLAAQGATLESDVDIRMDDLYISSGEHAAARVEIGDNADYDLCTQHVECYPASADWWQDNEINAKVEIGDLDFNTPLFVFVTHSDNKRRMSYPLSALQGI